MHRPSVSAIGSVEQLATFTGFENIRLDSNGGLGGIELYLGSQSIAVTSTYVGGGSIVYLGGGAVTFQGPGSNDVICSFPSNWNAGNSIDTGSNGGISLSSNSPDGVYDLTTNTLHTNFMSGYGANLTVKINSAVASGIANFMGPEPTPNWRYPTRHSIGC